MWFILGMLTGLAISDQNAASACLELNRIGCEKHAQYCIYDEGASEPACRKRLAGE